MRLKQITGHTTDKVLEDITDIPPEMFNPPAQIQQMDQAQMDRLQPQTVAYTTDKPDQSQGVGRITDHIDSQYIEDLSQRSGGSSRVGNFRHIETPAGIITYVNGGISSRMLDMFMDDFYSPVDTKLVVLNSTGGEVRDIRDISEQLRAKNIPVAVPSGAVCMSACNVMFAAGVGRYAAPDARFMIHHVRYGGDQADGTRLDFKKSIDMFEVIANLLGDPQFYQVYRKELKARFEREGIERMTWENDHIYVSGQWMIDHGYAAPLPGR